MVCPAGPREMPGDPAGAGARGEGEGRPHQVPQRGPRGHSGNIGDEGRVGPPGGRKSSVVDWTRDRS